MRRCAILVFVLGCGEGLPFPDQGDAGTDGPFVPAAHGAFPQLVTGDGGVLAAPNVVPIFFANDALQPEIESLIQQVPGSTYWSALQTEYGVGPLTYTPAIVLGDAPPASATDQQVAAFIAGKIDGDPTWPPLAPGNIYFIYYPDTTTLSTGPEFSCTSFGGYHSYGQTANTARFVFAVAARCPDALSLIDDATLTTTHELVEASTDPFIDAYSQMDLDHVAWGLFPGAEAGDLCEIEPLSYQRLIGASLVARFWSNSSAAAGHDPCAPAIADPYFNAVPVLPDQVGLLQGAIVTSGVIVPLGTSVTIDVQLFSDGPTADWTLEADDSSVFAATGPAELSFSWDVPSGNNGDTRKLTITRVKDGAIGGTEFVIHSFASPTQWHEYFALAGNQ